MPVLSPPVYEFKRNVESAPLIAHTQGTNPRAAPQRRPWRIRPSRHGPASPVVEGPAYGAGDREDLRTPWRGPPLFRLPAAPAILPS